MADLFVLLLFFIFDFTAGIIGISLYPLLLFPPYLFIRNYSVPVILYGGAVAVVGSELLHQNVLGSYLLGVGLAIFIFHSFMEVINWQHFLPQSICLLGYFVIVILTRLLLVDFLYGHWIIPSLTSLGLTYCLGVAMLFYRFNRSI